MRSTFKHSSCNDSSIGYDNKSLIANLLISAHYSQPFLSPEAGVISRAQGNALGQGSLLALPSSNAQRSALPTPRSGRNIWSPGNSPDRLRSYLRFGDTPWCDPLSPWVCRFHVIATNQKAGACSAPQAPSNAPALYRFNP